MIRQNLWSAVAMLGFLMVACGGDPAQNGNNNDNENHNAVCGDGTVDSGEECDDGALNSDSDPDACRSDCRGAYCGDGVIDPGESEVCDDGGVAAGDGCDGACQEETGWDCSSGTCEEICGDDLAVGNETCDGPDLRGEDCISVGQAAGVLACSTQCEWNFSNCVGGYVCGDGTEDPGEGCDDGNTTACDGCSSTCQPEVCGDLVQECAEVCDDGNTVSGDGCSADCLSTEACGNGIVDPAAGEACDDTVQTATCDADCTLPVCGDGEHNAGAGEVCDDGNTVDGDLCSADCQAITCPSTSSCVEDPPGSWQGPVILHDGVQGDPFPTCPVSYPTAEQDLNAGLRALGDCACECAPASGMACGNVLIDQAPFGSCTGAWNPLAPLPPGVCTDVTVSPSSPWFEFTAPATSGGNCAPGILDSLLSPVWQDQSRICGGATVTAAGCQTGELCAPDPGAGIPFGSQLCIYAGGDSLCPGGSTYSERSVYYSAIQNSRSCGPCTCGTPVGSCEGYVSFRTPCSEPAQLIGSVTHGQCTQINTSDTAVGAVYNASPTASCLPSAGSIQGAATGTGAVTVCCQP